MINLTSNTISNGDIDALCDWLKTYPHLTKGELVREFETKFSEFVGSKFAVFVNSGSSANLLMIDVLKHMYCNKIAVPALSWATDLAPVMQLGMRPTLIDCDHNNLGIDTAHFEEMCATDKPDALILVSVLGISPSINSIRDICKNYGVMLVEDACESLGTTYGGKYLGTFGLMGTYSMYYSHHISTIEGGMIVTDDESVYNLLLMLRAHGWDRDLDPELQDNLRKTYDIDDFNAAFTFYVAGYNVRPTEIQAFIGLRQLERAKDTFLVRQKNAAVFKKMLGGVGIWTPSIYKLQETDVFSSFGWPILAKNRPKLVEALRENGIGCRPLIAGSLAQQPMYSNTYGKAYLPRAKYVHEHGLYVGNNSDITEEQVTTMCEIIIDNWN